MNSATVNGQPVDLVDSAIDLGTHFAQQINPIPIGQLVPFPKSLGGAGMDAPIQAARNVLQAQNAVKAAGDEAWQKGDHVGAVAHYINWLLPVIGPVLDKAGTELREGRWGAGIGDTLGLSASMFGPKAIQAAKETGAASKLAATAEKGAEARAVETMAPQVGPNKVRLGNQAADVGPDVLRQTTAHTRGGMLDQAGSKLSDSYAALDAAYDKIPDTRPYITRPIRDALEREIKRLSVEGAAGTVEPANRAARIGALRQALEEVKGLGGTANLDNLRNLRIAWDEGAQGVFTPAVAQDFLAARGKGHGWADARSVLNDYIVSQHPELKPLNADAHLWKTAVDVMQAAEEADRVRPKVGRSIMARGLGAATGGAAEGPWGAAVGAVIGPSVERLVSNLAPAMKITVGRQMTKLADAIRAGQAAKAQSLVSELKVLLRPVTVGRAVVNAAQGGPTAPVSLVPAIAGQP